MKTWLVFSTFLLLGPSIFSHSLKDTTSVPTAPIHFFKSFGYLGTKMIIDTYLPDLTGDEKMDEKYQSASVSWWKNGEEIKSWETKVRTRGNVRKQVCGFPPLKIKFDSTSCATHGWAVNNKVKLVFPCGWSADDQQRLLKEYAAYQVYNIISPFSLQTVLCPFEIRQSGKVYYAFTGFMIEEEQDFMARTGYQLVVSGKVRSSRLDRASLLRMMMFQYLILNTDLGIDKRHNLEIAYDPASRGYIPIPYDFDYAGIVDQPYAIPSKGLGIRKVTQPLFLMKGVQKEELRAIVDQYLGYKPFIISAIKGVPGLTIKSQEEMLHRVNEFYHVLEDEVKWKGELMKF